MKKIYPRQRMRCGQVGAGGFRLRMLVTLALLLTTVSGAFAQTARLTISRQNATMSQIIADVERQSNLTFAYSIDAINAIGRVNLNVREATIGEVMDKCLEGTNYTYALENNVVVLKQQPQRPAAAGAVTGTVRDAAGQPMIGVAIQVKGTTVGASTDANGAYRLVPRSEDPTLLFSYLGKKTVEMKVSGRSVVNVTLEDDAKAVEQVTVIAYGTRDNKELVTSVSSVKAVDIDDMPSASVENLLQGHMAGVEVNNVAGSPGGGGTSVRIRGYNSLIDGGVSDGSPLYVIDGIPVNSFVSPVTGTNTLAEIDPSTIASVEVLKDAASAAMYGSRAANGVILITTKQGQTGKGKFTANVSYSHSILPTTPEQLIGHGERQIRNAQAKAVRVPYLDYMTNTYKWPTSYYDNYGQYGAEYDMWWNNGRTGYPNADRDRILQDSINPFYNNNMNWWEYMFNSAKVLNANVQASGGSETVRYMVGAGWYDEEGITHSTGFSRANVLSNLNITPRKDFKIDARLYLAYTDRSRGGNNTGFGASTSNATSRYEGINIDPRNTSSMMIGSGAVEDRLLRSINDSEEVNQSIRIRASLAASYTLFNSLTLSSTAGIDYSGNRKNSFAGGSIHSEGYTQSTGENYALTMFTNDNMISYKKSFNSKHNLEAIAILSYSRNSYNGLSGSALNGPHDDVHYVNDDWPSLINNNNQIQSAQSYRSSFQETKMLSYLGRIAYNFDRRYLVEFTLRRDGSSVFEKENRWATFPSVAVGWNFSDEEFMRPLWWLSHGKLRVSWGKTGNQFDDPYMAHGILTTGGSFLGNTGLIPQLPQNTTLSWERDEQWDAGLDVDLFDNRVRLKADYYYRYSSNMLYNTPLPGNVYFHDKAFKNVMEISNQGFEIEAYFDILRHTDVKWRLKFNVSRNWNRLEKTYTNVDLPTANSLMVIGKPIYGLYVLKDLGIVQNQAGIPVYYDRFGNKQYLNEAGSPYAPGMILFEDMNMDGNISMDDRYLAETSLPAAYGGLASELTWKGFDMNVLFTYTLGRHIINNYAYPSLAFNPNSPESSPIFIDAKVSDFWQKEGDNTKYPSLAASYTGNGGYGYQFSAMTSAHIEKVNYLRLKQLTLGYNIPKSFTQKIGVEQLRVFITAENLFLWTNYSGLDPEIIDVRYGIDNLDKYPLARKTTIGLTLTF